MLETLIFLFIALLIVMPVVAILLMGLQRIGRFSWKPMWLAAASVAISLGSILAYAQLR